MVTPIPVTESVDASGYESVSTLDPQTFCAAISGCGSGRLLVAVALGLGLSASVASGPVFLLVGSNSCRRKGTDPKTSSDPKIFFDRLESGSFGGHPRG